MPYSTLKKSKPADALEFNRRVEWYVGRYDSRGYVRIERADGWRTYMVDEMSAASWKRLHALMSKRGMQVISGRGAYQSYFGYGQATRRNYVAPRFKSLKPLARRILTRAVIAKMVGKFDYWHYQALESYDERKVERQASAFYGGMSDWSNPGYYEDLEYPVHPLKRRKRVHKRIPPLTPEELEARRQWLEDLPF